MQTVKENFKALSEGDAGSPSGASKLVRSLFLILLLLVSRSTEVLAALQRAAKGAKISSCPGIWGTGCEEGRIMIHQVADAAMSPSFVGILGKTEYWLRIIETEAGLLATISYRCTSVAF